MKNELQPYLEEIKTRLESATPGPWKKTDYNLVTGPYSLKITTNSVKWYGETNPELIANAPTDLKILVEMVELLTTGISEIEASKHRFIEVMDEGVNKIIAKHRGSDV